MAIDKKFHQVTSPISVTDLPQIAAVQPFNSGAGQITHAAMPHEADDGAVIFIADKDFLDNLPDAKTFTIITTDALAPSCPKQAAIFTCDSPRLAFSQTLAHLYCEMAPATIASTAIISPEAQLGRDVTIGDYAIIEAGAVIGDGCNIGAHSLVGAHCEIGAHSHIASHVTITHTRMGKGGIIHANSVIGKSGFGFEMTAKGAVMMPHLGTVIIGDKVSIGSVTTIDRGVLGATVIGDHVMLDNHVHIAHNVEIGAHSIMLSQVGIAGSSVIGKNVILAGKVGVKDHMTIADNVIVLSAARVVKNIEEAGTYGGYPAIPATQHWREQAALRRLVAKKKKGS